MKSTLYILAVAGLVVTAQAQTLLYQWTFNGGTGTPDVTAGGGSLAIATVTGTGSNLGYNSSGGPGVSGANGALTVSGGGYNGGNTSVAIASNLSGLGTLSQISWGFWFNLASGSANQFPRLVSFGASSGYDAGGKGTTVNNGIGSSVNGWTSSTFPATTVQNGVDGASGNSGVNDPQFGPVSIAANTWYYELITYDGTQTVNNFTSYLGSNPNSLSLVSVQSVNTGSIAFGSSASVLIGNDDSTANVNPVVPRALSNGSIANVEIWSGIVPVPEPASMTLLGLGSLAGILAIRRRRN